MEDEEEQRESRYVYWTGVVVAITTWLAVGRIGQHLIELESFSYIMAWGMLTFVVCMKVERLVKYWLNSSKET